MRVVIQRVSEASVLSNGLLTGTIKKGLLVLAGIEDADTIEDVHWLTTKIVNCRIFADEDGVMNRSVIETGGEILLISQFTLHASTRKGNRPSYIRASKPAVAVPLYNLFIKALSTALDKPVATGIFGADMQVSLVNDGPVTIIIDSKARE